VQKCKSGHSKVCAFTTNERVKKPKLRVSGRPRSVIPAKEYVKKLNPEPVQHTHGRHSRAGGNPFIPLEKYLGGVPAFAGTTLRTRFPILSEDSTILSHAPKGQHRPFAA
jgi:hypothetical protein